MARFIVRLSGKSVPSEVEALVRNSPRLTLIEATDRMLSVEGSEADVRAVVPPDAKVFPDRPGETDYKLPDTKPKVRQP